VLNEKLFEYKTGSRPWATFNSLPRGAMHDNNIFYGRDESRGILFKVEGDSKKSEYQAFWSWTKPDQSPLQWNKLRGEFIEK
jgi:hypothetical protein